MILMNSIPVSSDEVDGYFNVFQKWGTYMGDIYLHPIIFGSAVIILFFVFLLRLIIFLKQGKEEAKAKNVYSKYKIYIFAHMIIEYLVAFLFTYLSIKLSGAYLDSYIINCIISEIVGLMLSILIDYCILIPLEDKTGLFTNPLNKKIGLINTKKTEDANSIGNQNNITINFGTSKTTKSERIEEDIPTKDKTEMEQVINIDETTEAMVKSLIDMQERQERMMEELGKSVIGIRDTMMTTLRFELHDEMMKDIVNGFTTQDRYDRISAKYHDYTENLKGNHGIELLFEKYNNLIIK